MTHKAHFIRAAAPLMLLAQLLRQDGKGDPGRAIAWAETLWDRLVAAGYGPAQTRGQRPIADRLAALPPDQAAAFAQFWRAYALPKGKQAAAARWAQIAPDAALAAHITAAADADAREARPEGQARKWPEGWLAERRWEDRPLPAAPGQAPQADPIDQRRAQVQELLGERARLLLITRTGADPQARDQLTAIDERLRAHGIDPGAQGSAKPRKTSGPSPVAHLLRRAPRPDTDPEDPR